MFNWLKQIWKLNNFDNGQHCSNCANTRCAGMDCQWMPNEKTLINIKEYLNKQPQCKTCYESKKIYDITEGNTNLKICKTCFNEAMLNIRNKNNKQS